MGGGATIRAAAKVAGIGVVTSGTRGGSAAEYPASFASRKAVIPASAGVVSSSSDGLKAVQLPVWEIDDWDFAGDFDDGLISDRFDAGKPREVFGPVPSLQEAKEATSELKDALEKVYFSSPHSSVGSFSALEDTKACITNESSVPNAAVQAYMFLKERPAVQTVVASIASDPNVWNAMVQNPALREFVQSETRGANSEMPESLKTSPVSFDDAREPGKFDRFRGFMKDVKHSVQEKVSRLSNYAQNLFSEPKAEKTSEGSEKNSESSDGTFRNFFAGGNGGSLMALVMMVIMMVVMKRV